MQKKEGIEVVKKLARWADVIIASYKPGDAAKLGVDPMCEKLASLSHERRVLVDFIEWLQTERRGMEIYDLHTEKDVLAFLEIDPVQLERERWQMLDELHKKAEEKADG